MSPSAKQNTPMSTAGILPGGWLSVPSDASGGMVEGGSAAPVGGATVVPPGAAGVAPGTAGAPTGSGVSPSAKSGLVPASVWLGGSASGEAGAAGRLVPSGKLGIAASKSVVGSFPFAGTGLSVSASFPSSTRSSRSLGATEAWIVNCAPVISVPLCSSFRVYSPSARMAFPLSTPSLATTSGDLPSSASAVSTAVPDVGVRCRAAIEPGVWPSSRITSPCGAANASIGRQTAASKTPDKNVGFTDFSQVGPTFNRNCGQRSSRGACSFRFLWAVFVRRG